MLEMYTKKQRVKEMPLEFGVDKLKPVLSGIEAAGGVDLYLPNPSIPNEILVGIAAAHGSVDVYECVRVQQLMKPSQEEMERAQTSPCNDGPSTRISNDGRNGSRNFAAGGPGIHT